MEKKIDNYWLYYFELSELCHDIDNDLQLFKIESIFKIKSSSYSTLGSFMDITKLNGIGVAIDKLRTLDSLEKTLVKNLGEMKTKKYKSSDYFHFS